MDAIDRLFELLDSSGLTQQEFASLIGVKKNAVTKWKTRESASYTKYLPQIAQVLNTTTEYILTGADLETKETPASANVSEDDIKAAFFEGAEDLSQEEMDALWDDARDYMRYKLEQRRRQKK
ncbi:MAG: helix-turn-helix transcriptional regulator [Oscillibacter sp.]|nr:helix-turn-helix transcriptional regulator [Oscillibacter sp.]